MPRRTIRLSTEADELLQSSVKIRGYANPSAFLRAAMDHESAQISGLPPEFQSLRRSVVDALKQGGRSDTQSGHSRRISGLLVIAKVGLALAALVTMGLFLRSLYGLQNTPAGFDHRNVTVACLFLATNNYTPSEEQQFSRRLRERLLESPGVTGAAYSDSIPLGFGREMERHYGRRVCGEPRREPGRASRLGVARLLQCAEDAASRRTRFKAEDNPNAPRVMIVNESFARRFLDGRDPVGRRVQIEGMARL
jgi:putative ABC transport system permease protein